jgi:formate dehydrogenase major subunit
MEEMDKGVGRHPLNHGSDDGGPQDSRTISRRDWFRASIGGSVGLAVGELMDVSAIRAGTKELKLSKVSEFTTSCNFCSCGSGMIAAVREGKLITMEGDFDHIVNRGSLCVKGISMFATHTSPQRLTAPRYRAPGSDHWEEISWKDAAERVAQKIKKLRDETWVATESHPRARYSQRPAGLPHESRRSRPVVCRGLQGSGSFCRCAGSR